MAPGSGPVGRSSVHPCPPWGQRGAAGLVAVTPACGKGLHLVAWAGRRTLVGRNCSLGSGGTAGLFPLGAPHSWTSRCYSQGANLPGSCRCTYCLHKELPCWDPQWPASQVESRAQVTAWKPRPHPRHHPTVILVSSSWGPRPGSLPSFEGVSGDWLLFPLVTRPQETKRDSVLVQFCSNRR